MSERTYGVLLRVYTPKPEEVSDRVDRAVGHLKKFRAVAEAFPALRRMVFLVPRDYDCGGTGIALDARLAYLSVSIKDILRLGGHHSCEVLNDGVQDLMGEITHCLIISGKAMSYLTPEVMRAIDQSFANGAKVAGLAVDELRDVVLSGRIQNTFAAWDIQALREVGGFDSRGGVEEVAPIARLVQKFGRCIAPIDVQGGELDIAPSETARARHLEVMATKLSRQQAEVERVGSSFAKIEAGIMPDYPQHS